MNILVIGNGFDLAHGLPTTYGDFLKFVQNFQEYPKSNMTKDNTFYFYFEKLQKEKIDIFNEMNILISGNWWLAYFAEIFDERCKDGKTGWIDFESEMSTIIQAFDSERLRHKDKVATFKPITNSKRLANAIFELNFTPDNYKKFKSKLYKDLNRLTRCLEIYLSDYIQFNNCKRLRIIEDIKVDKVLSFNYTDTYETLYDKDLSNESEIEYDYIHGKASLDSSLDGCKLVLGIDEYLIGDSKNRDNEFIQFKKFYQRIYKGTGSHYINWLEHIRNINNKLTKSASQELNIYIYGHSLDVTDADILRRLILEEGAKTHIFYHNQEALGSQIANLVKVIGEDELIKRTYGGKRTIIFIQSSTEVM